jgi:hypothetical protein
MQIKGRIKCCMKMQFFFFDKEGKKETLWHRA